MIFSWHKERRLENKIQYLFSFPLKGEFNKYTREITLKHTGLKGSMWRCIAEVNTGGVTCGDFDMEIQVIEEIELERYYLFLRIKRKKNKKQANGFV